MIILVEFIQSNGWSLDLNTLGQIASYIVTVVIGGVGYKYLKLVYDQRNAQENITQAGVKNLINNLEERIRSMSTRIQELENKREEAHDREVEVTRMLAESRQKVKWLEQKVQMLEREQKVMRDTIDKYYKCYGPLDEIA